MNLPNKLTMTRILLIPVFVVVFYLDFIPYNVAISAAIFALAAGTDFLDGYIARSRNLVTNLGKFLDPIADKVLVSTALILLLTKPAVLEVLFFKDWGLIVSGICVAIILARELIIGGFRMVAAERKLVLAADIYGKIKTSFTDVVIGVLLVSESFLFLKAGEIAAAIGVIGLFIATGLTVFSGANYLIKNKQVLSEVPKEE